ncbi:hypothetical protein DFJ63DRAFT_290633 [Scheffersomyces coipomensis]|uniref:uncharacterized protein n=1 Tax=Scheffersomyces coipomensis TaxID=1788519 RepID=UPI00315CC530
MDPSAGYDYQQPGRIPSSSSSSSQKQSPQENQSGSLPPNNQPATPRMLRSVSGTLKNSKSDINQRQLSTGSQPPEDLGSPNYIADNDLSQHPQANLSFQNQPMTPQQIQSVIGPSNSIPHPPSIPPPPPVPSQQHKRVPSFSKGIPVPVSSSSNRPVQPPPSPAPINTSSAVRKSELLPPAAIGSGNEESNPAVGNNSRNASNSQRYNPPSQQQQHSDSHQSQQQHHHHSGNHNQPQGQAQSSQQQQPQQPPQQQQQFYRKSIGDWDFVKTIGAGSMGKVKLAQHNSTREICAVKIIPRAAKLYQRAHANDLPPASTQEAAQRHKEYEKEIARDKRTIREGSLGRLLFHPFICRLYEMVPMTNHYYMLFEYVEGGQMLDYIVAHGSLKEKHARKFARGIGSALDYCHRNNVVHRDLKIENIMISESGDIKIIDFGLSNLYSPKTLLKTYCGSLYFAAPELLSAKPYTGPEVDIWSFGVVLYVLVCGKVPFDDQSVSVLHEKIKKGNVEYPNFLSRECISLLSRMLVVEPSKRATLYEVLQHPWMNKGFDYKVSNYLPKRVPLTLPLDPEIIKSIASFDLGSIQHITEELTNVLTSVEYQMSCENWYKLTEQGREYASASNAHILPDPTGGFHPLISIYFLVLEMKSRKKAKEALIKLQQTQSQQASQKQQQQPPHQQQQVQQLEPQQPAPTQERSLAALTFPEQAHTSSIPTAMHKNSQSPPPPSKDLPENVIPEQQLSPRESNPVRESLDPNAGKNAGINSILRKLSYKKKYTPSSPSRSTSPPPPQVDVVTAPPPLPSLETASANLSPQSSVNTKRDPMVRRGVSMKITAKEKSTNSRLNLHPSNDSSSGHQSTDAPKPRISAGHSRSSSVTKNQNKFHGFIPVEILPPVPKYTGGTTIVSASSSSNNEKTELLSASGRKLHPTARAKSVGGHMRKDSYNYRKANNQNSGAYPPLPNAMASQNSDELIADTSSSNNTANNKDGFFDDVRLDDLDFQEIPQLTEDEIIDQFNNAKPNTMPSIEHCKTLFLKGFFSVQTTSTKPLPVIRYNIINVLSKLGVRFQEVKGGFVCIHTPSVQADRSDGESQTLASHADEEFDHDDDITSEEKKLYGDAFKSTSSIDEKETPRVKTPEPEQLKTPSRQPSFHLNSQPMSPTTGSKSSSHKSSNSIGTNSGNSGHRRKFSIGNSILGSYRKKNGSQVMMPPNTPATAKVMKGLYADDDFDYDDEDENIRQHFADDNSADSLNGYGGGSDMLISSKVEQKARHQHSASNATEHKHRGGKSPLKFEIHIVKVPLVGLYGVQFKKLLGNTWNYKTLASQVLNELNL